MSIKQRVQNFLKNRDARKRQRARDKAIRYYNESLTDFQKYERQFKSSYSQAVTQQQRFEYFQKEAVRRRYYQRKAKEQLLNKAQHFYQPHQDTRTDNYLLQPVNNRISSNHQYEYDHANASTENTQQTTQ